MLSPYMLQKLGVISALNFSGKKNQKKTPMTQLWFVARSGTLTLQIE